MGVPASRASGENVASCTMKFDAPSVSSWEWGEAIEERKNLLQVGRTSGSGERHIGRILLFEFFILL